MELGCCCLSTPSACKPDRASFAPFDGMDQFVVIALVIAGTDHSGYGGGRVAEITL